MSEKIAFFMTVWILVVLFITGDAAIEIFLVLICLGFIIAKELTDRYNMPSLKHRVNIFVVVLLLLFLIFTGKRIITFLTI